MIRRTKERSHEFFPKGVAIRVHVEAVFDEDIGEGFAVGAEHVRVNVNECQARIGADEVLYEAVGFAHAFDLRPPGRVWSDGDVGDASLRKLLMDFADERLEILGYLNGSFAGVDVVAAGIHDDLSWSVWKYDAFGKVNGIGNFRATEAAVENFVMREVLRQRFPQPDAGASDEEDGVGGRWVETVGGFKGGDFSFPTCMVVGGGLAGNERKDKQGGQGY